MNDSLNKLLECLEPKIQDIHENRIEIKSLYDVYETISEIVKLGEDSFYDILDYYDQDFIIKAIKIGNFDSKNKINDYIKTRYLLKNTNVYIKELPQYKEALGYMENLYEYLYNLYKNIKVEYDLKKENLSNQELFNKYYFLLQKNNIFIEDIQEFITCLDLLKLENKFKLEILIIISKYNIKNYITTNDIMITNDIKLSNVEKILKTYKEYEDDLLEKDNLEIDLKDLLKIPNKEILIDKKKFLYNKINELYKIKKYDGIIKYYIEFQTILDYENEFKKQEKIYNENIIKKLVFVMDNNKSLVRKYLENTKNKYRSSIYKNLLDIENDNNLLIPYYCYNNIYLYIKDEFVIKTVYTFLENGLVLILGVLDNNEKIEDFVKKDEFNNLKNIIKYNKYDYNERDIILKDIKIEDLVLTIDLNTLDIKNGGKDEK